MLRKRIHIAGALPFSRERVFRVVSETNAFQAGVLLEYRGGTINGKSMLGLLTLSEETGRDFDLVCSGEDEEEALLRVSALLEDAGAPAPRGAPEEGSGPEEG